VTRKDSTNTVCFIGSPGLFSYTSLQTLIDKQINVRQIIFAGKGPAPLPARQLKVKPPSSQQPDIAALAAQQGIPLHYADRRNALATLPLGEMAQTDFILVACFPYRLPRTLIDWPRLACLNIHPSCLPAYRGPDPVFWQLQQGERQLGVTLHHLNDQFDAGAIVAQTTYTPDDGASPSHIASQLSQQGTLLFTKMLSTNQHAPGNARLQNETQASYFPLPTTDDYQLHTSWSAQRAFNFMRGTCSPSGSYLLQLPHVTLALTEASDYSADAQLDTDTLFTSSPLDGEILIQFSPGTLRAYGQVISR
jgi:methionyl-tRNA formyltransferase